MIYGYTYQGSGIGNQLHRYVATRVKAKQLNTDWRMIYVPDDSGKQEGFKADFLKFDKEKLLADRPIGLRTFNERKVTENMVDIRPYDPEFNFIEDNTVIDGEFQDERYWEKHEVLVDDWLSVEPLEVPDDTCVIGFRGGEFSMFPELYLTEEYWKAAIYFMQELHGIKNFEVHTDDALRAQMMFPDLEVISHPETNWRTMRTAKYAIIANSSFFIFPRWLRNGVTFAPRYWARRNTRTWALPQNYYGRFFYV